MKEKFDWNEWDEKVAQKFVELQELYGELPDEEKEDVGIIAQVYGSPLHEHGLTIGRTIGIFLSLGKQLDDMREAGLPIDTLIMSMGKRIEEHLKKEGVK